MRLTCASTEVDTLLGIENLFGGSASDRFTGGSAANSFVAGNGNETLKGGLGKDTLDGGKGKDTADYSDKSDKVQVTLDGSKAATVKVKGATEDKIKNIEHVTGGSAGDKLTGDGLDNRLSGRAGADKLAGGGGKDTLEGGAGKDDLTGGRGKDHFVFNAKLSAGGVDTINDFKPQDDTIDLDKGIFTRLGKVGHTIGADAFATGSKGKAEDKHDRIVYETDTGKLFYDADGSKSGHAIQIALLDKHLSLTQQDFLIV